MRRLGITIAALCTAVAGCGIQPTGVVSAGDPPKPSAPASTVVIYLVSGTDLVQVRRAAVPGNPEFALDQLVAGPTPAERQSGITTQVPGNVSITYFRGVRPVLLIGGPDRQLANDGLKWPRLGQAQLACTVEAVSGAKSFALTEEGASNVDQNVQPFGDGIAMSCSQFDDLRQSTAP